MFEMEGMKFAWTQYTSYIICVPQNQIPRWGKDLMGYDFITDTYFDLIKHCATYLYRPRNTPFTQIEIFPV